MTKSEIKIRIKEINSQLQELLYDDRRIKNSLNGNWRDDKGIRANEAARSILLELRDMLKSELINPTTISSYTHTINKLTEEILDLEWELKQKKREFNIQLRRLEQHLNM